jgi:hypothetical protein
MKISKTLPMKTKKIFRTLAIVIPTSFNLLTSCNTTENGSNTTPKIEDRSAPTTPMPDSSQNRKDSMPDGGRYPGGAIDTSHHQR